MHPEHILPLLMVCLSVGSAVGYGLTGDWWHVLYWVSATGITIAAVFMG